MKGQYLIIVMIKPFKSTMAPLQRKSCIRSTHVNDFLIAHNWWSVEYENAASGTTQ